MTPLENKLLLIYQKTLFIYLLKKFILQTSTGPLGVSWIKNDIIIMGKPKKYSLYDTKKINNTIQQHKYFYLRNKYIYQYIYILLIIIILLLYKLT